MVLGSSSATPRAGQSHAPHEPASNSPVSSGGGSDGGFAYSSPVLSVPHEPAAGPPTPGMQNSYGPEVAHQQLYVPHGGESLAPDFQRDVDLPQVKNETNAPEAMPNHTAPQHQWYAEQQQRETQHYQFQHQLSNSPTLPYSSSSPDPLQKPYNMSSPYSGVGEEDAPKKGKRILGLVPALFWVIVGLVILLVLGVALGAGLGVGLSNRNSSAGPSAVETSSSSSSSSAPAATSSSPSSTIPSSATSASITASSTTKSSSATATPSAAALIDCPSSNNTVFTASNGRTFILACDIDFQAFDLSMSYLSSYNECAETCAVNSQCVAFEWQPPGPTSPCYLKSKVGTAFTNTNVWGGRVTGNT